MKKRISIKDLEDLAKEMPILTEKERKTVIGGSIYVDYNGSELGRFGFYDNFCIVDQEAFKYAQSTGLDNYGIPLSCAGNSGYSGNIFDAKDAQKAVFARYAKGVIGYTGEIEVVEDFSNAQDIFISKDATGTKLCFNVARSGAIFTEMGLESSLKKIHIGMFSSGSIESDEDRIKEQINYIKGVIAEFDVNDVKREAFQTERMSYASQLCALWHEQGHAGVGYEIWDAYRECGVEKYKNVFPVTPK